MPAWLSLSNTHTHTLSHSLIEREKRAHVNIIKTHLAASCVSVPWVSLVKRPYHMVTHPPLIRPLGRARANALRCHLLCCFGLRLSVCTRGACTREESLNSGSIPPQNYAVSKCATVRMVSPRLEGVLGASHPPRSSMWWILSEFSRQIWRFQYTKKMQKASRLCTRVASGMRSATHAAITLQPTAARSFSAAAFGIHMSGWLDIVSQNEFVWT